MTTEEYVKLYESLPFAKSAIIAPYFHDKNIIIQNVKIVVRKSTVLKNSPAVSVFGDKIYVLRGVLDTASANIRGHDWRWDSPRGISLWCHEFYHVYQFRKHPLRFLSQGISGIFQSLKGGSIYEHKYFPYEQEAIAFEKQVYEAELDKRIRNVKKPN